MSIFTPAKSYAKRFQERRRLHAPFIRRTGTPILVHSTHDRKTFEKILKQGMLKTPSEHGGKVKCPYMAELLGIDNAIFFSVGFVYATTYDFSYSFIFDIELLKELEYYRTSIIYRCYRNIVDYWYRHDRKYLEKLGNHDNECRAVVDKYYYEQYRGKVRKQFDFWRIEKTLFEFIQHYSKKQELLNIIKKTKKEFFSQYPKSAKHAKNIT